MRNSWVELFKNKRFSVIGVSVVILAGAGAAAVWGDWGSGGKQEAGPSSSPAVTVSPSPSGSPTAEPTATPVAGDMFSLAACPPDVMFEPNQASGSAGFMPIELPARQPLKGVKAVSAGQLQDDAGYGMYFGTSFTLMQDGAVYGWGTDLGNKGPAPFPVKLALPDKAKQVEGRFVLLENGSVYDLQAEGGKPLPLKGMSGVVTIAQTRDRVVYAVGKDGTVQQYSLYGPDSKPALTKVKSLSGIVRIFGGPVVSMALDSQGKLWKLPNEYTGGAFAADSKTMSLQAGEKAVRVDFTREYQTLGYILTDKGNWFAFSDDGKVEPAMLPNGTVQVAGRNNTIFALKKDGTVWGWGENPVELDLEGPVPVERAKQVEGLSGVTQLSAGFYHLMALTGDGRVQTLGSNMYGQLGRLPIYSETLQPLGQWPDVAELFPYYGGVNAVMKDGSVWSVDLKSGSVKPVMLGQKAKKVIRAYSHAVLTVEGRLYMAEPGEEQDTCKELVAPAPIVDANGSLIVLEDGRVFQVSDGQGREIGWEEKPVGKVNRVYLNPLVIVLTDKGELYYEGKTVDGVPVMKRAATDAPIREYSAQDYVFFEGFGSVARVLDDRGSVYDVFIERNQDGNNMKSELTLKKTSFTEVDRLTGAAVIAGGKLQVTLPFEHGKFDVTLPAGLKLRSTAAMYHYPIEGESFFYHLLVSEDGTIYTVGNLPWNGTETKPGYAG